MTDKMGLTEFILFLSVTACSATDQQFQYPKTCADRNTIKSVSGPTPPLPRFPDQFEATIEGNLVNQGRTVIWKEFYDGLGNRAAVHSTDANFEAHTILDYQNNQALYVRNGVCTVTQLSSDNNSMLFGLRKDGGGKYHVYTSGAALHFAKENGLTYMGRTTVRGIEVDHWMSCMYWDYFKANFTLDYFFSTSNWSDPTLYRQIPIRAEVKGIGSAIAQISKHFHHIYEYFDFRPTLSDSNTPFQTPEGVICPGRKQTKTIPTLPNWISFREEIVVTGSNEVLNTDVWLDYDLKLVRYDYRPSVSVPPSYTTNLLTEIRDYSTGLAYTINRIHGNCSISTIRNTSFDVKTSNESNHNISPQMKSPIELFYIDNTYSYEGQRTVRGMLCDVFVSNRTDFRIPGMPTFHSIFELYFLSDFWVSNSNVGLQHGTNVPVKLNVKSDPSVGYQATYHFYNVDLNEPPKAMFDISRCYADDNKLEFRIDFPDVYGDRLEKYKGVLLETTVKEVLHVTHLPEIRLQKTEFHIEPNRAFFRGSIMGKPPSFYPVNFLYLPTVWNLLRNTVAIGHFNITLAINGSNETFTATSVAEIGPGGQEKQSSVSALENFHLQVNKGIPGYDDLIMTGLSVDGCARECMNKKEWVCNSFEFLLDTGYCVLSKLHPDKQPEAVKNITLSYLYTRKYTSYYDKIAGQTLISSPDATFQSIDSIEDCAKICSSLNQFSCKSFDYCSASATCLLGKYHNVNYPSDDVHVSPNCSHYSRNFFNDFHLAQLAKTARTDTVVLTDVGLLECAQLCVQEDAFNCTSFDYCERRSECRLSKVAATDDVGSLTAAGLFNCSLYNRDSFPVWQKGRIQAPDWIG